LREKEIVTVDQFLINIIQPLFLDIRRLNCKEKLYFHDSS
jgi:hypothetical protein